MLGYLLLPRVAHPLSSLIFGLRGGSEESSLAATLAMLATARITATEVAAAIAATAGFVGGRAGSTHRACTRAHSTAAGAPRGRLAAVAAGGVHRSFVVGRGYSHRGYLPGTVMAPRGACAGMLGAASVSRREVHLWPAQSDRQPATGFNRHRYRPAAVPLSHSAFVRGSSEGRSPSGNRTNLGLVYECAVDAVYPASNPTLAKDRAAVLSVLNHSLGGDGGEGASDPQVEQSRLEGCECGRAAARY